MRQVRLGVGALAAAGALFAAGAVGAGAATAGAVNVKVPFTVSSLAQMLIAACAGEEVTFTSGTFNVTSSELTTGSGNDVVLFHRNVVRGAGVGATSGDAYYAEGHLQDVGLVAAGGTHTETFSVLLTVHDADNSIRWISPIVEHVTVTPEGALTSQVEITGVKCLTR